MLIMPVMNQTYRETLSCSLPCPSYFALLALMSL